MTFGKDVSSFQGFTLVPLTHGRELAFTIINVRDPSLAGKAREARDRGLPWSIYVWIFPPGHEQFEDGAQLCDRLQRGIDACGMRPTLLDGWWDYENTVGFPNPVEQGQLDQVFAEADQRGLRTGYYANPGRADDQKLSARPFWMAQYPDPNDGAFPGFGAMTDPGRSVQLWQFTSTVGTLDQNIVVDEAWFAALARPPAPAEALPKGLKMVVLISSGFPPTLISFEALEAYEVDDAGTVPTVQVSAARRQFIIDDVRTKSAARNPKG
jgi:hypothetical protein